MFKCVCVCVHQLAQRVGMVWTVPGWRCVERGRRMTPSQADVCVALGDGERTVDMVGFQELV